MSGESMGGNDRCQYPDCTNRATAEYEDIVPPTATMTVRACWDHRPNDSPIRFLSSDTHRNTSDSAEDSDR